MNKKFSTLLASFLLAGGLFSTADAVKISDVQTGKYYNMLRSAQYQKTKSWDGDKLTTSNQLFLHQTKDGVYVTNSNEGNSALWKVTKNDDGTYTFTNAEGLTLTYTTTVGSTVVTKFPGEQLTATQVPTLLGDAWLIKADATGKERLVMKYAGSDSEKSPVTFASYEDCVSGGSNYALAFDFIEVPCDVLTASELNYYEENGFSVSVKGFDASNEATVSLSDNYFTGHLTPMTWDAANKKFVAASADVEVFYLKNGNGNYIVVKADLAEGLSQDAYAFDEVSETVLKQDINTADKHKYYPKFSFCVEPNVDPTAIEYIHEIKVYQNDGTTEVGTAGRFDFKNVAYLAVKNNIDLKPIQIKLGGDQIADKKNVLAPSFFTVKNLKYETVMAAVNCKDAEEVSSIANVLEGQWALTFDGDNYVFKNRENPSVQFTIAENALYEVGTEDDYTYSWKGVKYEIKPVETTEADGYTRLGSKDELNNTRFTIAFYSKVFGGNAYFTEEHMEDHTIGLSTNVETASVWKATAYANARVVAEYTSDYQYKSAPTDSIYVVSTLGYYDAKGKYKTKEDILKVVAYTFTNQYGEDLCYNKDTETFFAHYTGFDGEEEAYYYALREEKGKLNLRLVSGLNRESKKYSTAAAAKDQTDFAWSQSFGDVCSSKKVYAGDTEDGLLNITSLYNKTENDLFVIEATDKPMYRRLVNNLDTVSIYRDENSSQLLYEEGKFLGLQNANQFEIAPAMLADAAYAPEDTYRPLYMLAVGTTVVPAGKYCPEHGVDAGCKDEHLKEVAGWVEGRYLVNLADSAKAWYNENKHKEGNPYINSEEWYRLGFVQATHRNDSLVWADNSRLYVGKSALTPATFAFRYVDQEAGSFVIETAYLYRLTENGAPTSKIATVHSGKSSYLKWMNGVVVAVENINDADVFNMNEEETSAPTANETISAAAVTVVAGEGNVTIAGAAGKKVVIANILGQTIANTVLTSDNATIAAPAGVVVVAVEGEAAVKAIVK